ncbi:hypothetical protein ACOSP7_020013 [Xanthoceras sorbifolium]
MKVLMGQLDRFLEVPPGEVMDQPVDLRLVVEPLGRRVLPLMPSVCLTQPMGLEAGETPPNVPPIRGTSLLLAILERVSTPFTINLEKFSLKNINQKYNFLSGTEV